MNNAMRIAVVGGGISGISTARLLGGLGHRVQLFEAGATLGGRIGPARLGERDICLGGKNIGRNYVELRKLLAGAGEPEYEFFGINTSRVEDGELLRVNSESKWESAKSLLKMMSIGDAYKLVKLVRMIKNHRAQVVELGSGTYERFPASSAALPLSKYFTPRCARLLIRPMVVRMNGAEPDEISVGTFCTNVAMLMDRYDQLRDGFSALFSSASRGCEQAHLNTKVTNLDFDSHDGVSVTFEGPGGVLAENFDHVFLALPAYGAATLVADAFPELSAELAGVRYHPVAAVVARYDGDVFGQETRAVLFDEDCPLSNAGAYGISDLDTVRYTFSGRAARQLIGTQPDAEALCDMAEAHLRKYILMSRLRRLATAGLVMQRGLCGYTRDHAKTLEAIGHSSFGAARLSLTGDYFKGVSLENCVRSATAAVHSFEKRRAAIPSLNS